MDARGDDATVHVVHVIARLNNGGPARVIGVLGRALAPHGIRTTVLTGRTDETEDDLAGDLAAAGIAIRVIPGLARSIHPLVDLRVLHHLDRHLRELRPDLVHTHTAKAGLLGRLAAWRRGVPVLHTYHGHVLHGYFTPAGNLAVRLLERTASLLSVNHALLPCLHHELAERFRVGLPWRWRVLPIPVAPIVPVAAPWHAHLVPGRPVIGFLGRLTPVKDPDRFLAVVRLVNRHRPVQALICGDGELGDRIRTAAAAQPFPCHCTGFVPAGEALGAMDLLLTTSRNEGLPLSIVEALGAGVPCVAAAVGGLPDLADGVALGSRRPADLARTVLALLDEPVRRGRQVASGRAIANRLAPAALAPAYLALYRRLGRADRG